MTTSQQGMDILGSFLPCVAVITFFITTCIFIFTKSAQTGVSSWTWVVSMPSWPSLEDSLFTIPSQNGGRQGIGQRQMQHEDAAWSHGDHQKGNATLVNSAEEIDDCNAITAWNVVDLSPQCRNQ